MANTIQKSSQVNPRQTELVMTRMWSPEIKNNPYNWVMYAFPWGVEGTPLENFKGPREWQKVELLAMAAHIAENIERVKRGETPLVYKCAVASGRGPGKSALLAWVTLWFASCILGAPAIISANNDTQLSGKTFAEISRWKTMCLSGHWFDLNQRKLFPQGWFAKELEDKLQISPQYYYAEGVLWNEDNPDAFAGAHSPYGTLVQFDEASGIPEPIWRASKGFFTDISLYRFWFAYSNPRRNTGGFYDCFHEDRANWRHTQIDARTVEGLDAKTFQEIIDKYGENSYEAKVEVKGEFPEQDAAQFISRSLVADAVERTLDRYDDHAALIMGVDVARFGSDSTVIRFRRGRDARSIPPTVLSGCDNMAVANKCAKLIDDFNPDAVFIDAGAGAGVIDRLKEMGYKVIEVWFGSSSEEAQYADHRTELWGRMRDWLSGAMLDNNKDLSDDLCKPGYEFVGREDKIRLESKDKMKKRNEKSPDHADALAVTFHAKIARYDTTTGKKHHNQKSRKAKGMDYKIFS